jgi:hypothetical protein
MSEIPDWSVYDKKMDDPTWTTAAPQPMSFDPKIINEQMQKAIENMKDDPVNNPKHYGGADNPYEAIKVIEAWGLGFNLGNTAKYISRAGKKDAVLQDLKKARWYLDREIQNLEGKKIG